MFDCGRKHSSREIGDGWGGEGEWLTSGGSEIDVGLKRLVFEISARSLNLLRYSFDSDVVVIFQRSM